MTPQQMTDAVRKTALAAETIEQRQRTAQVREDSWQTIARLFKRPKPKTMTSPKSEENEP